MDEVGEGGPWLGVGVGSGLALALVTLTLTLTFVTLPLTLPLTLTLTLPLTLTLTLILTLTLTLTSGLAEGPERAAMSRGGAAPAGAVGSRPSHWGLEKACTRVGKARVRA